MKIGMERILALAVCALTATGSTVAAQNGDHASRVINFGLAAQPDNLNPVLVRSTFGAQIAHFSFAHLVDSDAIHGIQPDLAQSWDVSEDGLVYRFYIRENAQWSDGTPITAHSIADSFSLMSTMENTNFIGASIDMTAEAIETENGEALQLTLAAPNSTLLQELALEYAAPLPMHRADLLENPDDWQNMATTELVFSGPYVIQTWSDDLISLRPNPAYFDPARNLNGGVDVHIYGGKDQGAIPDIQAGKLDFALLRNSGQNDYIEAHLSDYLVPLDVPSVTFLTFNTTKAPFDNARLRQAITLATERLYETSFMTEHWVSPVHDLMPLITQKRYLKAEDSSTAIAGDVALQQARAIMEELGYSAEDRLELELAINTSAVSQRLANLLRALWSAAYMDVTIIERPIREHYRVMGEGEFDIARAGFRSSLNHPVPLLQTQYTGNAYNRSGYSNPEFDQIWNSMRQVTDTEALQELTGAAMDLLRADRPAIPLYQVRNMALRHPDINWRLANFAGMIDLTQLTFDEVVEENQNNM